MVGDTHTANQASSGLMARFKRHGASYTLGGLLLLAGLGLHWWFSTDHTRVPTTPLEEMAAQVRKVDGKRLHSAQEGKVVFVTSDLRPATALGDLDILKPASYLKIRRTVEVYQGQSGKTASKSVRGKRKGAPGKTSRWRTPKKHRRGHASTLTPPSATKGRWVSSTTVPTNLRNADLISPGVQYGPFDGKFLLAKTMPLKALTLSAKDIANPRYSTDGTWIYLGRSRVQPAAGDKRVRYDVVRAPEVFSVVGVQSGRTIKPFLPRTPGPPQLLVARGRVAIQTLLPGAGKTETAFPWWGHVLAFLLVTSGIIAILFPFRETFAFLPLPEFLKKTAFVAVSVVAGVAVSGIFLASMLIIQTPWLFVALVIGSAGFAYHTHQRREEARVKRTRSSMVDIPPETQTNIERVI